MITNIRKMSLKTGNCLQEKIYSLSYVKQRGGLNKNDLKNPRK